MKFPFVKSIQARLIFSHLLVGLGSILVLSLYAGYTIITAARQQAMHHTADLAVTISNALEEPLMDFRTDPVAARQEDDVLNRFVAGRQDMHTAVYLPDGTLVTGDAHAPTSPLTAGVAPEVVDSLHNSSGVSERIGRDVDGKDVIIVAARVEHGGVLYGDVRLEASLQPAMNDAVRLLLSLVMIALALALMMSVAGYFFARSISRPVEALTAAANELAVGEFKTRVPVLAGSDEVNQLVHSFNVMAERVETLIQELRTFVSNASHELRTPLTTIKLRVEALRENAIEDPQVSRRFLSEIESEVDRLGCLVKDMLDLSRIEAGVAVTNRIPLDFGSLVVEVCEIFGVRAENANITLEYNVAPDLPFVLGSEDLLRRMLYNLVDNAIKYTGHNGSVFVSLVLSSQKKAVQLSVKDNGFGIAPMNIPHIFERFYRVEATRPRFGPPQGSGLGLSITRSIVEAHRGRIWVSSELGQGSTFFVELPTSG